MGGCGGGRCGGRKGELVNEKEKEMKVKVDGDLCIGCGLCVDLAEDVFEMDGDIAKVKADTVPANLEEEVNESASSCAVDAIIIEK